jgi:hypothetical protein
MEMLDGLQHVMRSRITLVMSGLMMKIFRTIPIRVRVFGVITPLGLPLRPWPFLRLWPTFVATRLGTLFRFRTTLRCPIGRAIGTNPLRMTVPGWLSSLHLRFRAALTRLGPFRLLSPFAFGRAPPLWGTIWTTPLRASRFLG